jgi:nucleoside-diphosphate kinase
VVERTLAIIKPDGVRQRLIGEILRIYEKVGLSIVAMKMIRLTKEEAEGFYRVHQERPFFNSLTEFMTSGPIVVLILEGAGAIRKNRDLMGATDPAKADAGTIRKLFATSVESNVVHGSDSAESAAFEIPYFFSSIERVT